MQRTKQSVQEIAMNFVQRKDNTSFKILIDRLKPGLMSYIYKYIPDKDQCNEIISQTFITIWEKLDQYDLKFNFSTWVYAIARNEALGILRVQKRNLSHEKLTENHSRILKIYSPIVNLEMEVFGPTGEEVTQVLYDKTIEEINNLKEPYKTVMIKREVNQLQLQDIADNLGWNLSTVKTRLRKARKDIAFKLKLKHKELIDTYYENL